MIGILDNADTGNHFTVWLISQFVLDFHFVSVACRKLYNLQRIQSEQGYISPGDSQPYSTCQERTQ